MKTIKTLILILFVAQNISAQPAEGAYFTNTELQLHPRKVIAPNGQIAYMWSDCYEQLNFMQRADLKLYYDSVVTAINKQIEALQKQHAANPAAKTDVSYLEAEKLFYSRKLKYISDYDAWEAKQ